MEQIGMMEPCCVERTLPMLLRKNNGWLPWQTNGDVTADKILKAVAHLAGNEIRLTVVAVAVDVALLRTLAWYFRRGWLKSLTVLTQHDQSELVKNELKDYIAAVEPVAHPDVTDDMLIIEGEEQTVVVQGRLLTEVTPGHCQYITYVGTDADRIQQFTATATSKIKVASRKKAKKAASEHVEEPLTFVESVETPAMPDVPSAAEAQSERPPMSPSTTAPSQDGTAQPAPPPAS